MGSRAAGPYWAENRKARRARRKFRLALRRRGDQRQARTGRHRLT